MHLFCVVEVLSPHACNQCTLSLVRRFLLLSERTSSTIASASVFGEPGHVGRIKGCVCGVEACSSSVRIKLKHP